MRPITFLRSSAVLLMASVLLTALPQVAVVGQATGGVRVGEPLHIYLRKDVAQQLLYLHFYPPSGDVPLTEATSRFALDRKGSLNATVVTFFPRDIGSNFLQFEPNASVEAKYQLMLFASRPLNVSDNKARLELIIELDYQNDNEYDERFVATVRFNATSSFVKVQGSLPMDPEELKKFDGKKGGKVRMTLARADDLDTIVVVHCGSSAEPSFVQLPFSKYRYVPSQDDNDGITPIVVLGVGAVVVVIFMVVLRLLTREKGVGSSDEGLPEERRKGRRWSKKGKAR